MKRLPIQGPEPLPVSRRPICKMCGKPLRPNFRVHSDPPNSLKWTHKTFRGTYGLDSLFCSISHGYSWAVWKLRQEKKND